MKFKFLPIACFILFNSFAQAQWTVVKRFSGEGNVLEIDSTGMYVQCGKQLFLKNDTANWKPYPIEGKVKDMLLSQGKLYYTFNGNLNQYNFGAKPTVLEDSAEYISKQGKDLIFYLTTPFVKKYISPAKSKDLLKDYNKGNWPYYNYDFKYASDDSIIVLGYGTNSGGGFGAHFYKNNKWFSPTKLKVGDIVNTISIIDGKILGIIGKSCEYAYYSSDYGKTEKVVDINIPYDECWGKSKILAFRNNVLFTTRRGIYATDTSFKKWDKILLDSNIVDAQVWGSYLYALTDQAMLLSYDLSKIVTSAENIDLASQSNELQYANGTTYNKSDLDKNVVIKNAIGKTVISKNIPSHASATVHLSDGVYFLYEEHAKRGFVKICVVN